MGEELKAKLLNYKLQRKKKIMIISGAVAVLVLLAAIFHVIYYQKDQVYYVEYNEVSNVNYKVNLLENDFFDEEYLGKGNAYVASLIESIEADIVYRMHITRPDVEYQYSYSADMTLTVADGKLNQPILEKKYVLEEEKTYIQPKGQDLVLVENVIVDYGEYNALADLFNETYELENTVSTLTVNMYVKVTGKCQDLASEDLESYAVTLNIPLTNKTTKVEITSNIPETEAKMLACINESSYKDVFNWLAWSFTILAIAAAVALAVFVTKTRNTYMNFTRKVQKLVSNYRSYIQKVKGGFDIDAENVVEVDTFVELLSIRDTIQKPVLMLEDEDKTWAKFVIPASDNLVYMYEMKMGDLEKEIRDLEEESAN